MIRKETKKTDQTRLSRLFHPQHRANRHTPCPAGTRAGLKRGWYLVPVTYYPGVGGCGCLSHKGPQKVRSLHASLCLEYAGPPAVLRRRRRTLDSPGSLVGPSDDHSMHAHARFMSAGQRRVQEAASRAGPQPAWPDAPRGASRRTERAPRWRYSNFRSFFISFLTILAHFPRGERVAEGRVRLSDAPCDVLAERGILIGAGNKACLRAQG